MSRIYKDKNKSSVKYSDLANTTKWESNEALRVNMTLIKYP